MGFVVETRMRQLSRIIVSHCTRKEQEKTIHTSAGEGLLCGQLIGVVDFALEFRRLPGSTVSKLARRASSVSISWLIVAKKGSPGTIRPVRKKKAQYLSEYSRFCGLKRLRGGCYRRCALFTPLF